MGSAQKNLITVVHPATNYLKKPLFLLKSISLGGILDPHKIGESRFCDDEVIMASFVADPENLAAIRRFVEESARRLQADRAAVDDMVQAVDEAATNIMIHGYEGKPGKLAIDITRDEKSLSVRIRDWATPFDPTQYPTPDLSSSLEERHPGGLGIFLMRQYVDQVKYQAMDQGGNELILLKKAF
jgi:serine/threonine-protein kinase RsbW